MFTRLRPAKVNFYLRFMQQRGFAAEQVLSGTGMSERMLADRHFLVEVSKYVRIISNIHRLCGSPSLAFELGEQIRLADLGILGYSVMTCRDTGEATPLWLKYNSVFFGNLIEMTFERRGHQVLLSYVPFPDIREDLLQFLIEEKIGCDIALQHLIGLSEFPMERLTLAYPRPAYAEHYAALRGPIEFSAERSALLLRPNALSIPLPGHDAETHEHCLKLLHDVFNSIDAGSGFSHKVKAILYRHMDEHLGSAEVAEHLCCSPRTLNRKLGKEGLCFIDLADSTRLETIKNLLATTNLESKTIADRIGFSDVRSLRRFFKAHTGKTIQQFRTETVHGS